MNKTVLVVGSHPDDELLGAGGTIIRHVLNGDNVYCLLLSGGVTSRYTNGIKVGKKELGKLRKEAELANKIMGVTGLYFRDFPDNRLDTVPLLDIVKEIESVKRKIKPEIVYTHHYGDLNIDHQLTHRATLIACRFLPDETVKEMYSFEIPSSTEWNIPESSVVFMPNVFIDITKTFDKKVEALMAYESESREYPHPRSARGIEIIARRWGLNAGIELAEAFRLVRLVDKD